MVMGQISDRELHEECGVFGVFGVKDAASLTYYGLHALQHRGQEGAGIVAVDEGGTFRRIKGSGLVTEVFDEAKLATLKGNTAIGHVRYTTAGGGGIENVQPFLFRHNTGDFALAHNGNLVNSRELVRYLEDKGSLFHSTSDSEILAHLIKKEHSSEHRIFAIIDALNMLEGGFAFLIMTENRLYACRDKYGLRPLSIGRLNDGWVVSSETCALDIVGAKYEKGTLFLPQLLQAASAAQSAFEEIKNVIAQKGEGSASKGRIVLATVKGDVHDIGKNIVKVILENYGFEVIDLGRDVPVETVVDTVREKDVHLVGLSALMTTTLKSMEETIAALHAAKLDCKIMVGGAVLTPEYAEKIGADWYAKDAKRSADIAKEFFGV